MICDNCRGCYGVLGRSLRNIIETLLKIENRHREQGAESAPIVCSSFIQKKGNIEEVKS